MKTQKNPHSGRRRVGNVRALRQHHRRHLFTFSGLEGCSHFIEGDFSHCHCALRGKVFSGKG